MVSVSNLLRSDDAARLLRVSRRTLAAWRHSGRGPRWHRLPASRLVVYDADELSRWLQAGATAPESGVLPFARLRGALNRIRPLIEQALEARGALQGKVAPEDKPLSTALDIIADAQDGDAR